MRVKLSFMVQNKDDTLNPHLPRPDQLETIARLIRDYRGRYSGILVRHEDGDHVLTVDGTRLGPLVQIEVSA